MSPERLIIFAQRPIAGRAKAGLVPPLSPDDAVDLQSACIRDVVARAARGPAALELWYEQEPGAAKFFAAEFPHIVLAAQSEGDTGSRITDAFDRAFQSDADHVIVLGHDTPTLPDGRITGAFDDVREVDVVFGPTYLGGCYLVGMRRNAWPQAADLLRTLAWSSKEALMATMAYAVQLGLDVRLLPGWYEIETLQDIARARRDADADSHMSRWLEAHEHLEIPPQA